MKPLNRLRRILEELGPMSSSASSSFPVGNGFEWRKKDMDDEDLSNQMGIAASYTGQDPDEVLYGLYGPDGRAHAVALVDGSGDVIMVKGRMNSTLSPKYQPYFNKWVRENPNITDASLGTSEFRGGRTGTSGYEYPGGNKHY